MTNHLRLGIGIVVAVGSVVFSAGGLMAATNTIASTAETTGAATDLSFSGGILSLSGVLPVSATDALGNVVSGYLFVTPLTEVAGSASTGVLGTTAAFGGGTFDISTTTTPTGNLLSGTFTSTVLDSANGSTGYITSQTPSDVKYTGGTFLNEFNTKFGGTGAVGNLTLDFSSGTSVSETSGNLNAFSAEGSTTTFDATTVPEASPASLAGFGAIGLIGLSLRCRKNRRTA